MSHIISNCNDAYPRNHLAYSCLRKSDEYTNQLCENLIQNKGNRFTLIKYTSSLSLSLLVSLVGVLANAILLAGSGVLTVVTIGRSRLIKQLFSYSIDRIAFNVELTKHVSKEIATSLSNFVTGEVTLPFVVELYKIKTLQKPDFVLKSQDGSCISVHKKLLEASSDKFKAYFGPNFKKEERELSCDLTRPALFALNSFMYTGSFGHLSQSDLLELLNFANYNLWEGLRDLCSECLTSGLENQGQVKIEQLLQHIEKLSVAGKQACFTYIHHKNPTLLLNISKDDFLRKSYQNFCTGKEIPIPFIYPQFFGSQEGDVSIEAKDGTINAHLFALAVRCPSLHAFFIEHKDDHKPLQLKDHSKETIQLLLDWIYRKQLPASYFSEGCLTDENFDEWNKKWEQLLSTAKALDPTENLYDELVDAPSSIVDKFFNSSIPNDKAAQEEYLKKMRSAGRYLTSYNVHLIHFPNTDDEESFLRELFVVLSNESTRLKSITIDCDNRLSLNRVLGIQTFKFLYGLENLKTLTVIDFDYKMDGYAPSHHDYYTHIFRT